MLRYCILSTLLISFPVAEAFAQQAANTPQQARLSAQHRGVLKQYCFDCHDSATQEGMMDLEALSLEISQDIATAERWAKVLNAINSGEMPPEDSQAISDRHKTEFLSELSVQMVLARKILSDSGGVITLRRLNRREYANSIEALLGIRPDVSSFPDDQATAGFDTTGASLFFSGDQFEQYLATARHSLTLALAPQKASKPKRIRIEPEQEFTPKYAEAAAELRDRTERAEAYFAQNEKEPSEFGFLDEYQVKKNRVAQWLPQFEQYGERPETKTGATLIMTIKHGGPTTVKLPKLREQEPGRYIIRVRAAAYPDARPRLNYLEFDAVGQVTGKQRLGWRKVSGTLGEPEIIEFPIVHQAGQTLQIGIHQRTHQDRADKNQAQLDMVENGVGTRPGVWIDWAELEGPLPQASGTNIAANVLFDKPKEWSDLKYSREVLRQFATAAFRGQEPDPIYLDRLVQRYETNRAAGQQQTEGLIGPLSMILASPSFLYMLESQDTANSTLLDARELAVRLSYFLWSEPPDAELLALGQNGELLKPDVLEAQTTRLLADSRAKRFVRGFVYQWLEMNRLGTFQFDGVQFPDFDNAVRDCASEEVFETFQTLLDEKLPLGTLLKSDFIVVNDVLAEYYGLPNVNGHAFRKVPVPQDSQRGGLLGTAAVLAMGSDGQRSSPVERGAWVLRKLLNDPPPPAPPNVPMLNRLEGQVLSARDLARAHQEQPQCANCHQKIDPIGYGLENFNTVGLWRETELIDKREVYGKRRKLTEFTIDPSGQLPDGKPFANYFELRNAVAEYEEDFVRGFTESLIAYGLGRPYGFTDQDLADEIMNADRIGRYEPNQLIHALVQSQAFSSR